MHKFSFSMWRIYRRLRANSKGNIGIFYAPKFAPLIKEIFLLLKCPFGSLDADGAYF